MSAEYYISSNKYSLQERQTKRGRVYDVVFRIITLDGDEKQKKLSGFTTKALAKQAYVDFVTSKCELVKNNPMKKKDPSKKEPTVRELLQEYIASLSNQNKDSTIYSKQGTYRAYIIPPLGDIPVKDLTKECLYKWQDYLWQTKILGQENTTLTSISQIFENFSMFFLNGAILVTAIRTICGASKSRSEEFKRQKCKYGRGNSLKNLSLSSMIRCTMHFSLCSSLREEGRVNFSR